MALRYNSEGVRRGDLLKALSDARTVALARQVDQCLLCRRERVNEAGLCELCTGLLEGEEYALVNQWRTGGPR